MPGVYHAPRAPAGGADRRPRRLATTRLDGSRSRAAFGRRLEDDFAVPLQTCHAAGVASADNVGVTLADDVVVRGDGEHTADRLCQRPQAAGTAGMG